MYLKYNNGTFVCSQVLDFIRSNKGMGHHLFCFKKGGNINVHQVIKTLKPAFSPQGNQRRVKEEVVMAKFIAFLKSTEGKVKYPSTKLLFSFVLITYIE